MDLNKLLYIVKCKLSVYINIATLQLHVFESCQIEWLGDFCLEEYAGLSEKFCASPK